MRYRLVSLTLGLIVITAACSSAAPPADPSATPAPTSTDAIEELIATSSNPVVLNVWASWCIPCRSEAPMLSRAAERFDGEVSFIALNVRDSAADAAGFITEFFPSAPFEHYADSSGTIPTDLGGNRGVPLTFFYEPGGELRYLHRGVIDERTLALQIDELLAGPPS